MNFVFQKCTTVLLLLYSVTTEAVELYSVFDNQCQEFSGYIIAERNNVYDFLSVQGKVTSIHKDEIKGLLAYNFVTPPLSKVSIKNQKLDTIKTLTVENESKVGVFSGFPVQFIEDLVVFLGLDGSVRVHKLDQILKIRPFKEVLKNTPPKSISFDIQSSGYVQSCEKTGREGKVKPNRILIDRLKIQQFLSTYKTGYSDLRSFEERTYLYARPNLYTQKTRFGLVSQKQVEDSGSKNALPFIEWSTGRPYRVQSLNRFGLVFDEYGADLDPFLGFKTELKAHFFHAVFTGNLNAIAAGSNYLIDNADISTDSPFLNSNTLDSAINYSALVGGDFGPHSFSVALYYPIYVLGSGDEYREVLATSNSYMFRYMHTTDIFRFYVSTSFREKDIASPDEDTVLAYSSGVSSTLTDYQIHSFFIRAGLDVDLPDQTYAGINFLYLTVDYDENSKSRNSDLDRIGGTAYVRRTFGDYVSFGARTTFLLDKVSSNLGGSNSSDSFNNFVFGFEGAIVF